MLLYFSLFWSLLLHLCLFFFVFFSFFHRNILIEPVWWCISQFAGFDLHLVNNFFHLNQLSVNFSFFSVTTSVFCCDWISILAQMLLYVLVSNKKNTLPVSKHEVKSAPVVAVLTFICVFDSRSVLPISFAFWTEYLCQLDCGSHKNAGRWKHQVMLVKFYFINVIL